MDLRPDYDPDRIFEWARIPKSSSRSPLSEIFIDTETSGLAGGTGTFAFMVGIGNFNENNFRLTQIFIRDPGEEKALLAYLEKFLARFSILISFNGKSFDVPILKTRYGLNQFPDPFVNYSHIDVLHLARRIWKPRLPNRSLKELESQILDFVRTEEEIPGWLVPQLYIDYLRSQDASPLKGVFYHNGMDVISLAVLYKYLAKFIHSPTSFDHQDSLDLASLARFYEDHDHIEEAANLYVASIDAGLPEDHVASTLSRYGHILKERNNIKGAIAIWEKAVLYGHINSAIDLAKVNEHQLRNNSNAKTWTEKSLDMVENSSLRKYQKRELKKELKRRLARLDQKIIHESKNSA
jgi:tetratricopeptide (TPR) repeat protein